MSAQLIGIASKLASLTASGIISGANGSLITPPIYADSVGNYFDENGVWMSAGNSPATRPNSFKYAWRVAATYDFYLRILTPSEVTVDLTTNHTTGDGRLGTAWYSYPSFNLSGSAGSYDQCATGITTTGVRKNDDVCLCVEHTVTAGTISSVNLITIRDIATLGFLDEIDIGATGTKHVSACPDGTWLVHTVPSGAGTISIHKFSWESGALVDQGVVCSITNNGTGGKTPWGTGFGNTAFIQQIQ